ncbi:HAMP domain-containing sensor histidine kinase [Rubellicoccus peritrichatus]|uniref:histidine kinase n=1 Tax=Rubellicoccus peritrichatus TaxID=3080537 RepID=A0AAQ3QUD8_9BACT|nr:HAMP domain-containing sensor histidine kinase [Puniceicoccus sp. CR14]WOO39587.1 HAMP domain-containing sensor histidine kinase [Puniceicoccus sp. CR14]
MNRELQTFLLQSQRSAALLMGSFCILLVIIQIAFIGSLFVFTDTGQDLQVERFLLLPLITAALAWLEFYNAKRIKHCINHCTGTLGLSRYLSSIGEAFLPTLGIFMILSASTWDVAISSPPLLGYFMIIIISMLRMESRITILIGVIESLSYFIILLLFLSSNEAENLFTNLELRLLFGRIFVIIIATMIAAFIVKKMRLLLNELIDSHQIQTSTLEKLISTTQEKAKAEEVIWQKDHLLSILGHDLRTPLNGVSGLSELMANAPEKFSAEEIRRYASEIHNTSQNLRELLDNLLAWAQYRTGQMEMTPREYSVNALIDPVIQMLRPAITAKAITLSIETDSERQIRIDRKATQTILRNLLSNAVKFTPKKGHIRITSKEEGGELSFQIIDSGRGIPQSVLDSLIQNKLSQSNPGTDQEQGTGLGLLLCMDIAKRAGIKLVLSIDAAGGTNASMTFPNDTKAYESHA